MRIFGNLYKKVISWAGNKNAHKYLFYLSFSESSFFPIPPDVMLIPMCLADRNKAWYFASITTIASLLGGIFGYILGFFIFDIIESWLMSSSYWESFQLSKVWFTKWGLWAVLLAGFSPIPYKIFTISAGMTGVNFLGFILFSIIGRGARFFLVSAVVYFSGEQISSVLEKYIERIGWLVSVILLLFIVYLQ